MAPPPPVVLLINSQTVKSSGDGDEDTSSLLYAFTSAPRASGARVFNALVLAVKGALASICGEQARAIHVQSHGQAITLALVHLQACVLVVVVPLEVEDQAAQQLALMLASSVLFLAGPSSQWVQTPAPGNHGKHHLAPHVKAALDLCSQGALTQGLLTQATLAPWLSFPDMLPCMQLPASQHKLLMRLLTSHQDAVCQLPADILSSHFTDYMLEDAASSPSQTHTGETQSKLQLYSRTCSMMYKGLVLVNGMPPAHQTLAWQVCCCLGAFDAGAKDEQDTQEPAFQVWVQPACLTACSSEPLLTSDPQGGGVTAAGPAPGYLHQHALSSASAGVLVVAACQGLVAAVLLQPYERRVDMLRAGQLEGVAAVGWVQEVQQQVGSHLESAMLSSPLLHSMQLSGVQGQHCHRSGTDQGITPMASLHREGSRTISPFTLPEAQNGLSPTATSPEPQAAMAARPAGVLAPLTSQVQPEADKGAQRKLQWDGGFKAPGGVLKAKGTQGASSPLGRSSNAHKPAHISIRAAPEPQQTQWTQSPQGSVAMTPTEHGLGSAVVLVDLLSGHMHVLFDLLPKSVDQTLLSAAWPVLARCHNRLKANLRNSSSFGPVTAQVNHHSLILTLSQVERLAGLRAPPEAGLRLGAADSAPWQHHPELALLSGMHQVTEQVPWYTGDVQPRWWVTAYYDAAAACQVLVLHGDRVREGMVAQQAKVQLDQIRRAAVEV